MGMLNGSSLAAPLLNQLLTPSWLQMADCKMNVRFVAWCFSFLGCAPQCRNNYCYIEEEYE